MSEQATAIPCKTVDLDRTLELEKTASRQTEAVWVFESNLAGTHTSGVASIAAEYHGAVDGKPSGHQGNSFAIPIADHDNNPLARDDVARIVKSFLTYAKKNQDLQFRILPFREKEREAGAKKTAELFRNAPRNCHIPGYWLSLLGKLDCERVLVLDSNVEFIDDGRDKALDNYFAANEGLWGGPEHIEIVSVAPPRSLVANDAYAKKRRYKHRIVKVNSEFYGDALARVREYISLAYVTRIGCLIDPTRTTASHQLSIISVAASMGIPVEDMPI